MSARASNTRAVDWNEISKGMNGGDPRIEECGPDDEGQMRAYWTQWDLMMRGLPAFTRSSERAA